MAIGLLATVAVAVAVSRADAAPACTITYDGPTAGSWDAAANWDADRLPAATDHACVPAGTTVTHSSGDATVRTVQVKGALKLTGGTLTLTDTGNDSEAAQFDMASGSRLAGAGALVVTGSSAWSGGVMTGTGTTRVLAGATLVHTGTPALDSGRVLENAGTIELAQNAGYINATGTPGASIHNLAGGVIQRTAAGTGTVTLYPAVDNDGTIVSSAGPLELRGGGAASSGSFGAAAAAGTVRFTGGTFAIADGAKLLGGTEIAGGTLDIPAGATATATGANAFANGTVSGAGALSLASGTFAWDGGTMRGAGTTTVLSGATLVHTGTPALADGRVLENAGTIDMREDASYINATGTPGATIHNLAGGTIDRTASGTGSATLYPAVENDGTIVATAGLLELRGGGAASSGAYGAATAGGVVRFASGTFAIAGGAKLLGHTDLRGGTLELASGATATASGPNTFASGTLAGAGTLAVSGTLDWSGGTMRGTGTTKVLPGATLAHSGTPSLGDGWQLENAGTIDLRAAASYINDVGADGSVIHNLAGGTIARSATGSGDVSLYPLLENDGTITSAAGNLELRGGGSGGSTGTFGTAGATGAVRFVDGTFTLGQGAQLLDGAAITDRATVTIPAGATATAKGQVSMDEGDVTGAGTLAISGAGTVFTWSGGTMGADGVTTVGKSAKLAQRRFAVTVGGTRRIDVTGTMELEGDVIGSLDDGLIHVLSGGVLRKTGGDRESFVSVPVRNDGTVDGLAGELQLAHGSPVPDTGVFKGASAAKHVTFVGPDHLLAASAQLRDFTEIGGTVTVAGGQKLTITDDVTQSGNSRLVGDVDVSGSITVSGGRFEHGTVTVLPAGKIVVAKGESAFSCGLGSLGDGSRLVNQGTLRIQDGSELTAFGDERANLENPGRIELDVPASTNCNTTGIVGDVLVHNTGTIEKTGASDGVISGTVDNDGVVVSSKGELRLQSGSTVGQAGTFRATAAGTTVVLDDGIFVLDPGAAFDGTVALGDSVELRIPAGLTVYVPAGDTLVQRGGTINGAGTLEIGGTLKLQDGDMEGPGTTVLDAGSVATVSSADGDPTSYSVREDRSLVNRGAMTLDGATLNLDDGASVLNAGTLEVKGASALDGDGSNQGYTTLLHNTGTLRKSGSSRIDADVPLDNDGTIEVAGGTLSVRTITNWTGFPFAAAGLVSGDYVVHGGTLVLPGAMKVLGGRLALDGTASKVVYEEFTGTGQQQVDALAPLRKVAGSGELELTGGRGLTVANDPDADDAGPFVAAGIVRVGAGSTLTASTGYRQAEGGVLQTGVNGASAGTVAVGGTAELAGRLDVASAARPAGDLTILTAGTVTGAFTSVTSDDPGGYAAKYESGAVKLTTVAGSGRGAAAGSASGGAQNVAVTPPAQSGTAAPADASVGGGGGAPAGAVRLDDRALRARGPWARRGGMAVAHRRGAALVRRGVQARTIAIVAATGPRSGAVQVIWRGRVLRTVSLRAGQPGRRTIRVASFAREQRGTLRLRSISARRVAVDAVVVGR